MQKHEVLQQRLRQVMDEQRITAMELARRADVRNSFIYDILNGKSLNPSGVKLAQVAEALKVSLSYLAGGTGRHDAEGAHAYVLPPLLHPQSEGEECPLQFRRAWLEQFGEPDNLRIAQVADDGMAPTLLEGDTLLVDTARRTPSPPGIFMLHDGHGLVAKRLDIAGDATGGTVRVLSDNPRYTPHERKAEALRVLGRVVWFGRGV